jgi:hypothetical protein
VEILALPKTLGANKPGFARVTGGGGDDISTRAREPREFALAAYVGEQVIQGVLRESRIPTPKNGMARAASNTDTKKGDGVEY